MRVLKDMVLICVKNKKTDSLVSTTMNRKGIVQLSGTEEIKIEEEVLFGEDFEEIDLNKSDPLHRYYLMNKNNIKIIFEKDNNLLFFKKD